MTRTLVPSAALLWGLQFAFLNPVLALILVELYAATAAEVGLVLAVYNASGFLAALVLPAYADRTEDYLRPMLLCGLLTLALVSLMAATTSLPVVVIGLVLLGGPAGVGSSLLFAHLMHTGASPALLVHVRAVVSFAWLVGLPLATLIIGSFGNRAILPAIAAVALLNIATTGGMLAQRSGSRPSAGRAAAGGVSPVRRRVVALVVAAFVALQATNSALVSVMSLFVTKTLGLDVRWAGIALGVAAGLEIPALLVIGRLSRRFSNLRLMATGCVAGIVYYVGMAAVSGPVLLLALQALNAWFFAAVSGIGMALFQQLILRPGLASGLYANARRLGAIVSGPIIAVGSVTVLGYGGVFLVCAAVTALGLVLLGLAARPARAKTGLTGGRRESGEA